MSDPRDDRDHYDEAGRYWGPEPYEPRSRGEDPTEDDMSASDVIQRLVGRVVVVRDNAAGVYCGELAAIDLAAKTWALSGARQAHYWTGAAATPGLAVRGPGPRGSRIGPVMEVICGADLVSVMPCTVDSAKAWADAEEWRP